MLFNSISFFVFLPIVLFLNYIVPNKFKWVVLLVSSCYFYMSWYPEFIILIFISTAVNYFCALMNIPREIERLDRANCAL